MALWQRRAPMRPRIASPANVTLMAPLRLTLRCRLIGRARSLVVLCDDVKFEIFDREASVDEPMLRVMIKDLRGDFDKIRAVLEPMQVWFFQKRRVVRLIDKVFNKEFNMHRIGEFSDLVDRRFRSKHQIIIENFRNAPKPDENADLDFVHSATAEDIIELLLFETTAL
jgi:hypothetical protein